MKVQGLIAALAVFLLASQAHAYEWICNSWTISGQSGMCPQGYLDGDSGGCSCSSTSRDTGAPRWDSDFLSMKVEQQSGGGLSGSEFLSLNQQAAEQWTSIGCSSFYLSIGGTLSATNSAPWGSNSGTQGVYWVTSSSEWADLTDSSPQGGTLGVTLAPYGTWGGCDGRRFSDADIIINGMVGQDQYGVYTTILHEMGHALGLGHPCLTTYSGCSNSCNAVMAATGGDYTTPQQDDINAVCSLYPGTPGGLGQACNSNSDCSSGPCITHEGVSYCSQYCGDCPTGYECSAVSGQSQNVCVRQGAPGIGEECTSTCVEGAICLGNPDGDGGTCFRECNPNASTTGCVGLETCVAFSDSGGGAQSGGFCVEVAGPGGDCEETNGYCVDGYVCIGTGNGAECLQTCDPNNPNCPAGYGCAELSDGSGACFERGTGQEGDQCQSMTDCSEGLVCVGGILVATCYYECDLQNPSCPFAGQECVEVSGADSGICSPVGGTDGTPSDTGGSGGSDSSGGDTTGGGTGGDTTGGTTGTAGGCACDRTIVCDPSTSGGDFCECDPECTPCTCDSTYGCDGDGYGGICHCDVECIGCACDTTYACDTGCELCDPECSGSGCAAGDTESGGPGQTWMFLLAGMLVVVGARRLRQQAAR
ncbi:MAG: hypothetical protein VX834_01475 [Myxococcota bacterium]|nr:hypothetical protein [Myxococcota bacterium]